MPGAKRVGCARLKLASAVAPSVARVGERRFDCAARERLGVCGAARVEGGERGPVERLAVARSALGERAENFGGLQYRP